LEDPGIGERIISKLIFNKCDGRTMEWIDLAQDKWWALVNVVMNLRFP
jgi:hypothetical protein